MFIDAESLDDQSEIEGDIAIVGTGVAGLTLARGLVAAGLDVIAIEAGGEQADKRSQSLYRGSCSLHVPGADAIDVSEYLVESRFREFGGTGNYWGGKCAPLDPSDFEKRAWIPHSGWPFAANELEPYYEQACDLLEIPRLTLPVERHFGAAKPLFGHESAAFELRPYGFTAYTGGRDRNRYAAFKRSVVDAAHVRVVLNANVTKIRLQHNGRAAAALQVRCFNGRQHRVRAKAFVVAAGGIENARLLLASDDVHRNGIGNHSDWLGRGFQVHSGLTEGDKTSLDLFNSDIDLGIFREGRITRPYAVLGISASAQRAMHSNNFSITLRRPPRSAIPYVDALAALSRKIESVTKAERRTMYFSIEHAPNRDSRLTLMRDRPDELGVPLPKLEIRLSAQDLASHERCATLLASEMGLRSLGRVPAIRRDEEIVHIVRQGLARHHMGATRMSASPADGVVDEHARVHGVENLYVAGSSIFPTTGVANPTLTIVAMALRLSERLRLAVGRRE